MAFRIFSIFAVLALFFAQSNGFKVDFIHRDSPLSPFYNPSKSRFDSLRDALHRSQTRAAYFKKRTDFGSAKFVTDLEVTPGEYTMKFSIGTPPIETFAIADTGSDLTWTQCEPCVNCFQQNFPLFDPKNSSSYKTLPCTSPYCSEFSCSDGDVCQYQYGYGDNSQTVGEMATETLAVGNVSFPSVVFGCGHQNGGTFNNATSGIVGLGSGAISIITQLDKQVGGKFAYCLPSPELNVSTHLAFGADAAITGPNAVVSTPLIQKDPATFYYLTLENISVGNITLKNQSLGSLPASSSESGNVIIDSGTTLTYLPTDLYKALELELKTVIKNKQVSDPQGFFKLCYQSSDGDFDMPSIIAHFTGADVELSPKGTFILVEEGLVCLTLLPATQYEPIFGNLSQIDYIVVYDLVGKTVSFKPSDCSKY